jgi:endoglycosylceramidase
MNSVPLHIVFLCVFFAVCNATIFVDPLTGQFIDEFGRVRVFHGVNAVVKTPPYHPTINGPFDPIYSLNKQDVANLYQWGFNFVRLGMMWPGVETSQSNYNLTYLNLMSQLISQFQMYNITVLIDVHQDLLSPKFCGEGVPDYAAITDSVVSPFPIPALPHAMPVDPRTGYPPISECLKHIFGIFYLADATGNAFQNFYNNVKGVQNFFGNFWQTVVRTYKSFPNVIGYEILNEPWPGDIYRDLTLLEPKVADRKNLVPLYNNIAAKIRQIDNDRLIFFEQSLIDSLFLDTTGFDTVPGGPEYRNRSVFSYHVYCASVNRTGGPSNLIFCDLQTDVFFSASRKEVNRLGCGGFMTEFGAVDNSPDGVENINFLLSKFGNNSHRTVAVTLAFILLYVPVRCFK